MDRPGNTADGGLEIGQRELRGVQRFSHEAMATVYEVRAVHPDPQYAACGGAAGGNT